MAQEAESRFTDFDLCQEVQSVLPEMGFVKPTPIQAHAIPVALTGKDVLGKAETGTGKTLAFGLPLINRLDPERTAAQALCLLPTRELAQQVAESLEPIAKSRDLRVALLVGGEKVRFQRSRIPGRQIIVGTPGRILDLLQERYLHLEWTEVFVLDEFDRMLDMGFIEDVQKIVSYLPKSRQTLLFSATVPHEIRRLVDELLEDPVVCEVSTGLRTAKNVEQRALRVRPDDRMEFLLRMLESDVKIEGQTVVVFCNTRRAVSELDRELWGRDLPAAALSGDYEQSQRFKVMDGFRAQRIRILVATDVASRGLDVDHVGHVINYDVPLEPEDYVHRIGRTARAGRDGRVTTLVVPAQEKAFRRILDRLGKEIQVGRAAVEDGQRRAVDRPQEREARRPAPRGSFASARGAMQQRGPVRDDIAARRNGADSRDAGRRDAGRGDDLRREERPARRDERPRPDARRDERPRHTERRDERPRHEERRDEHAAGRPERGHGDERPARRDARPPRDERAPRREDGRRDERPTRHEEAPRPSGRPEREDRPARRDDERAPARASHRDEERNHRHRGAERPHDDHRGDRVEEREPRRGDRRPSERDEARRAPRDEARRADAPRREPRPEHDAPSGRRAPEHEVAERREEERPVRREVAPREEERPVRREVAPREERPARDERPRRAELAPAEAAHERTERPARARSTGPSRPVREEAPPAVAPVRPSSLAKRLKARVAAQPPSLSRVAREAAAAPPPREAPQRRTEERPSRPSRDEDRPAPRREASRRPTHHDESSEDDAYWVEAPRHGSDRGRDERPRRDDRQNGPGRGEREDLAPAPRRDDRDDRPRSASRGRGRGGRGRR